MTARVQVVVAHPDDETFGCGSLLLHAVERGAVTAVCCATLGEAGDLPAGSRLTPKEVGHVRRRELHSAAALLGVSRIDLLGFVDSGMTGDADPSSLVGVPFGSVVEAVQQRLEAFQPDIVVTLDGSDGHRDHARIRDATIAAAQNAAVGMVYLQCLPRSLIRHWVEYMRQGRPDVEHLAADVSTLGTPDEDITTVIDTAEHLNIRERAIAAHASQASPFDGLPEHLRRAFLATDHARRIVPPWTGGPLESQLLPETARQAATPRNRPH